MTAILFEDDGTGFTIVSCVDEQKYHFPFSNRFYSLSSTALDRQTRTHIDCSVVIYHTDVGIINITW